MMDGVTSERVIKIENGTARIQPEDVVLMAECYHAPELRNYYCTHECAIGQESIPEVKFKPLSQIAI